jgi:lysozyme
MIMMQGDKKTGEAFGGSGKSNKQTTEKIFDKLELLPLSGVNAQTTETQQTTESTETQQTSQPTVGLSEQIAQITKDRVFEEYLQLNRQFFSKIWARSVMIDATWGSGTTIYNSSIAKLNEELNPIVDKWITQRPQVESAFGLNYFDMSSAFRERWQKEEGNKVITIDINGQIRKPYLEQPQLGPDTENTFLNNIFFNQGSSDAVVEGQTLPQTPPPPTNPLPDNTSDSKPHRSNVSSMNISAEGVNAIKRFEGFREDAYQDTAGVWTIGYGTTEKALGYAVTPGMKMSKSEANTYLMEHLKSSYVPTVKRYITTEATQGEFDAMVSFVYNLGSGNFSESTLLKKFNAGDHEGAANEFVRWNKAKNAKTGKKEALAGLTTRRLAEKETFLS